MPPILQSGLVSYAAESQFAMASAVDHPRHVLVVEVPDVWSWLLVALDRPTLFALVPWSWKKRYASVAAAITSLVNGLTQNP